MRAPCAYQSRRASRTGAKAAGSRLVAKAKGARHGRGHRTTAWVVLAEARCNTPNTTITRRMVPSGFCSEGPESRQAKATQTFSGRFVDEPQQQRWAHLIDDTPLSAEDSPNCLATKSGTSSSGLPRPGMQWLTSEKLAFGGGGTSQAVLTFEGCYTMEDKLTAEAFGTLDG